MSDTRLWRLLWLSSLFITFFLFPLIDSGDIKQLTFCEQKSSRSLLFVSTLDGKISALDANNLGKKLWTLEFNDGPMLSSSIHRRELNNNGQWVRLIPSLNGKLYKFDGDNLEAVPLSASQLLQSSFRYSDDLVFSGGREVKSYGVSSSTGKVLYECGMDGCTNTTDGETYIQQEVLIIQRFQQTVRAVEPHTGIERWNFSVGQHDLVLVPVPDMNCQNEGTPRVRDVEIKVVVPDGLIWAVSKNDPAVKLWQYKFDSPIVSIWREDASKKVGGQKNVKEINLFDSTQYYGGTEFSASPGIYLGMHNRQLYIQENTDLQNSLEATPRYMRHVKYPWRPYAAIGTKFDFSLHQCESIVTKSSYAAGDAVRDSVPVKAEDNNTEDVALEISDAQTTTALSVLYNSEYINGNGFYLFSTDQLEFDSNKQCNGTNPELTFIEKIVEKTYGANNTDREDDNTPVQVIIVSLWYWWKEVLIISITTAVLLNFMLTQRLLNATTGAKDATLPPLIVERYIETNKGNQLIKEENDVDSFNSRYLTDFLPVNCLGKGGYGVVFEAKNKIDDCNYAIKRIALPNSNSSRERVMREVKALAKLEHPNIVRYFNAWLECPPPGWQEKYDPEWMRKLRSPNSDTGSSSVRAETKVNNSACIDVSQTDTSIDSAREAYESDRDDADEDASIVFEKSQSANRDNVIDISDSTESSYLSRKTAGDGAFTINDRSRSESIVFKESSSDEKEKRRKRQKSFSLDLNSKPSSRRPPKMFLYIQMQLCQKLSLREWLKNQSKRDSHRVLNIFQQIVDAVEYVHLQGLIHRDLKPSNIFFSYDDKIKVGDFGLVTAMTESYNEAHTPTSENKDVSLKNSLHTAYVGTHLYMSPEQMNGQGYNYKVDIYSLGIILFELLIPFVTEMERSIALMNLRKLMFPKDFGNNYPAEFNLLNMMLDGNPNNRPTTFGIKARPPLLNQETVNGLNTCEDTKWHFELPQISRHSSVTSSSSAESWENMN